MEKKQSQIRKQAGNDNFTKIGERSLFLDVKQAISFYSIFPIISANHQTPNFNHLALALPFAGLLIGILPALILFILLIIGLPSIISAIISVAIYAFISGAMAEDAIGDSFDGLFGGKNIAQRLEILKDSKMGTYGIIAIVLYLLVKIFALSALASISALAASLIWLGVSILARSTSLYLMVKLPPARKSGASANIGKLNKIPFIIGMIFATILGFIFIAPFVSIFALILAIIFMFVTSLFWTKICDKLLNGQTGDLIGALQALNEIVVFCAILIVANI